MKILLDRDTFRLSVFQRDKYRCVICGFGDTNRLDAHHIMEIIKKNVVNFKDLFRFSGRYSISQKAARCLFFANNYLQDGSFNEFSLKELKKQLKKEPEDLALIIIRDFMEENELTNLLILNK